MMRKASRRAWEKRVRNVFLGVMLVLGLLAGVTASFIPALLYYTANGGGRYAGEYASMNYIVEDNATCIAIASFIVITPLVTVIFYGAGLLLIAVGRGLKKA